MQSDELMTRMYEEIKVIRAEVEEIREVLVGETEPTEKERAEIEAGLSEMKEGKVRSWEQIKGEL